jgi:DNA-binding transcriptional ArsR family regulator
MNNITCIRPLADINQINACREKIEITNNSIIELSGLLGLAGNDVRLKILYLLHEEKELCVCDLSDILNMKIPAVSQHLRKLKDGKLIDFRKEAQTFFYYLKPEYSSILEPFFKNINSESKIFKEEMI